MANINGKVDIGSPYLGISIYDYRENFTLDMQKFIQLDPFAAKTHVS